MHFFPSFTNEQAPFVTMFMYLNEGLKGELRNDLALIIEEVLVQRISFSQIFNSDCR